MIRSLFLLIICFGLISETEAQRVKKTPQNGMFSLGMRSTISAFNHMDIESPGLGYGAQFRLFFHPRINTEWYADYLTSSVGDIAQRNDAHVGWSVMFYFLDQPDFTPLFKPYLVTGHCFDYTSYKELKAGAPKHDRWSAAIQTGVGTHINLTERFDLSVVGQYMFHLGDDLHVHIHEGEFEVDQHGGNSLEGHFLFTLSLNYKIAELW
ncbi:MAG: hypothetical protein WD048_05715 [Chitinophagales bacterium]